MRSPCLALLCVCVCVLTGCVHDVTAAYPARGDSGVGTVVVQLSNAAPDLTVAVNGALVATRQHARRVAVSGVPAGAAEVDVAFGGGGYARAEEHVTVDVVPGVETAVVLPGPERSTAAAIENGLGTLGEFIWLGFVYAALL